MSTTDHPGELVKIAGTKRYLRYSMLSLEKIEKQFGSIAEMQAMISGPNGEVRLDRPVIGTLIDVIHAGLLDDYPDTPDGRSELASGFDPAEMAEVVEAMTRAFADSFGEAPTKPQGNRAARRARSPGASGTTPPPSRSDAPKKSGKK